MIFIKLTQKYVLQTFSIFFEEVVEQVDDKLLPSITENFKN